MESTLYAETVAAVTQIFGPPAPLDQLFGYEVPEPAAFVTAAQLARRERVRVAADAELAAAREAAAVLEAPATAVIETAPELAGASADEPVVATVEQLDPRLVLAELRAFSDESAAPPVRTIRSAPSAVAADTEVAEADAGAGDASAAAAQAAQPVHSDPEPLFEPRADADTAALMRELSSLGSDEPVAPQASAPVPAPRPVVRPQPPAGGADHRRRKGFFGR